MFPPGAKGQSAADPRLRRHPGPLLGNNFEYSSLRLVVIELAGEVIAALARIFKSVETIQHQDSTFHINGQGSFHKTKIVPCGEGHGIRGSHARRISYGDDFPPIA